MTTSSASDVNNDYCIYKGIKVKDLLVPFQMFRHGDRSAIGMIPNDIYNVSSWTMGPGELTPVCKELALSG